MLEQHQDFVPSGDGRMCSASPSFALDHVRHGERFTMEREGEVIAVIVRSRTARRIPVREWMTRSGDLRTPDKWLSHELEAIQIARDLVEPSS
jgi:hypothetical protein